MVKSKTATIGFWLCSGLALLGIGLGLTPFFQELTGSAKVIAPLIGLLLFLFSSSQLWRDAKTITINSSEKVITFVNLFTRQTTTYNFDNLEGYVDLFQPSEEQDYRVLYLVKDKKFVEKISTFIYSNVEEMEAELKAIKYLGLQSFSYTKSFKILFGQKVLDDK